MSDNSSFFDHNNEKLQIGQRIQVSQLGNRNKNTNIEPNDCGIIKDIIITPEGKECFKITWNKQSNVSLYPEIDIFARNEHDYDPNLHERLLTLGSRLEKTTTHQLEPEMINGVIATIHYFEPTDGQLGLLHHDLLLAKYKIFDWLGMWYTGRYVDPNQNITKQEPLFRAIEQLVILYTAMRNVGGWAWSIRGHIDLTIEDNQEIYKRCHDCIFSYNSWHNNINKHKNQNKNHYTEQDK